MERIRIALADDQKLFVESLSRTIVSRSKDIAVVGIAYDGNQIVSLVEKEEPDLILMDVRMPGMDGVAACQKILESHPKIKVIMLTTFDDDEYILQALHYGAVGYLLKNISPEEVITSIRAVMHGAVQMSSAIARKMVERVYDSKETKASDAAHGASIPDWYGMLSPKERSIVMYISKGNANKEISEKVCLAEQTVKNYISAIFRKLGVDNRASIIRMFLESNIPVEE